MASEAPTPHWPPMTRLEKGAEDEERKKCGREAGEELDRGGKREIGHERNATAVAVGEKSEDQSADGAQGQGDGESEGHADVGFMEFAADVGEAEDDQEKIESVESPAGESD